MSDTLEVFGLEYQNIDGIQAQDDNGNTLTFYRPQGTKSITANGVGIDVAAFAAVDVAVPSSVPSLQAKTNIAPTTSSQTITPDVGYDGLSSVQINAMPSGSATPASTISATEATVSTGTNTLTLSKTVSNTPTVSAGYVSSGTAGNSSVSLTASVTTKAAATIHPSTSDQSIAASQYLTGAQTIKGVLLTNLLASIIKKDEVVKVGDSTDDDCVTSVTGTYEGGGGGGSTKLVQGTFTTSSSSGAQTVTIPYTGSGYPISASIYVDGGMRNPNSSYANLVKRYAIGNASLIKAQTGLTPTYETSGDENVGIFSYTYKNSTSSATTYGASANTSSNSYTSSSATSTAANVIRFNSKTSMSVYVIGSSNYGLAASTTYHYDIVYSS